MAGKAPSRFKSGKAHLSKPYEKPKSILHKVARTVKDLLLPSWLTASAWTADPENEDSDQEDGPRLTEREDEIQREDAADHADGPDVTPFANRDGDVNFGAPRDSLECSFVPREMPPRLPSASTPVSPPPSRAVDGPALMNGDSHSENSEASGSTSGCSSLVPSLRQREGVPASASRDVVGLSISEAGLERLRHDLSSRRDFGVTADLPPPEVSRRGETQLWSEESVVANGSLRHPQSAAFSRRRPSFSLSAFGTSINNSSVKSREDSRLGSSFYEGRTTYGGAAAYRRLGLVGSRGPYETEPKQVSVPCKRAKGGDDATHMSTTTRRILQSLERVATPLSEAKKVPLDRGPPDPILSYTPASQRRRLALGQKSATPPVRGPPSTSFARPVPVRLERNLEAVLTPKPSSSPRDPLATGTSFSTQPTPVSTNKVPVSCSTEDTRQQDDGGGGKMRAKVVQHQRPSLRHRKAEEEETVQVPNLPNVALPITTLPSFRPPPQPVPSPSPQTAKAPLENAVKATESKPKGGLEFQFSAPLFEERKGVPTSTAGPVQEFSFSKPTVLTSEGKDEGRQTAEPVPPAKRKASPLASRPADDEGVGSPKAASQLIIGGSVMDILGKPPSSTEKSENGKESDKNGDPSSKPSESGDKAAEASAASSSPQALWEKFKPAAGSWSCPTCMISNTGSAAKCAACETPKPGSSSGASGTAPPVTSASSATSGGGTNGPSLGSLFKPPASSWECDTCLVRNKADATKCIACEVPKPGAAPKSLPKAEFSFKFGVPTTTSATKTTSADSAPSSGFKFGMPSSTQTTSSSGFKFGVPTTSSEQSSTAGFKFGVPATTTASSSSTGFKFGTPTSASEQGSNSGFKFGIPSTTSATSNAPAFKFGISEKNEKSSETKTVVESPKEGPVKTGNAAAASSFDKPDLTFKFGADSKNEQKDGSGGTAAEKSATASSFTFGGTNTVSPVVTTAQNATNPASATTASGFSFHAAPQAPGKNSGFSFPVATGTTTKGFTFGTPEEKSAKDGATKAGGTSEKGGFSFVPAAKKPVEGVTTVDGFSFESPAKKREEEPKSGSFSLNAGASDKGGFSFGAPKPTGTSDKGGFSFGTASKSDVAPKDKGGFSFGIPAANSAASSEAPKSGFAFGVPSAEKTAEGTGEKAQQGSVFGAPTKGPTFSFGGQQTGKAAETSGPRFLFGQKTENSPGTFTFGAATATAVTTTQSSTPLFNFKPSVPAATAPSQPAFGAKQEGPQASPFTFGGAAASSGAAAPPSVFSFGAAKTEPAPAAPQQATSVFSFGASSQSQAPAAGAAAPSASQSVFSFGASQAPASASTPQVFSFGANSSASTPFGSATQAAQSNAAAPTAGTGNFSFPTASSPFGANQTQGAAAASPFGGSQPQPATTTPFGMNQASQGAPSVFGAAASQSGTAPASGFAFRPPAPAASPAFQFGSSAPGSQEVFRFGAQTQSQEPQAQQPAPFNFTAPVAGAAPAFGQQAAPAFNFGTPTAVSPTGFQFQAGADGNPFSATGTGSSAGRRFRKAVRRKPPNQR